MVSTMGFLVFIPYVFCFGYLKTACSKRLSRFSPASPLFFTYIFMIVKLTARLQV